MTYPLYRNLKLELDTYKSELREFAKENNLDLDFIAFIKLRDKNIVARVIYYYLLLNPEKDGKYNYFDCSSSVDFFNWLHNFSFEDFVRSLKLTNNEISNTELFEIQKRYFIG